MKTFNFEQVVFPYKVTGNESPSRFDGSYEFIPCPSDFLNGDKTKVRWKGGSSVWWALIQPFNSIHQITKVEFGSDFTSLEETKEPHTTGANSFYFGLHKTAGLFPDPVAICVTNSIGTRACGMIPIVSSSEIEFELNALL